MVVGLLAVGPAVWAKAARADAATVATAAAEMVNALSCCSR
tara:strand:- start:181 stop:303 length:123 start_codon:yes stop_codon:yes gene_type:complete